MRPIKVDVCNFTFTAPKGEEDHVQALHVLKNEEGSTSFWMPSKEELDALNDGHPVLLTVLGASHPCVMLQVCWSKVRQVSG